ncbi:hypothetical protein ACWEOZ_34210 [Actinoplanes sp. NPDC004185]
MEIFTTGSAPDLADALRELLAQVDDQLRIQAFPDRAGDAEVAAASGRPAGFGWGSYHRGGPLHGSFLQITGAVTGDVAVPGQERTLGDLQAARAAGNRQTSAGRGRPLLHLHLTDRAGGIRQVLAAAEMLRH